MAEVIAKSLVKVYGRSLAVRGIDLNIPDGSFTVFVGPSGCGKSTTLRMIAGLEDISYGDLEVDGQRVNDLPSRERGVAMVFQSYALYPHKTVRQNLKFSLDLERLPMQEIERRLDAAVSILELEPYLERKPAALSGGQRQRVAMGRAIVREPRVFLFDEPLSNLDAKLRNQMRVEIKRLQRRLGVTTIYVTHDQVEAMTMADQIVVMRDGMVEQTGTPMEIFKDPANVFVAGFVGTPQMNFFDACIKDGTVNLDRADLALPLPENQFDISRIDGMEVTLGLRPEDIIPKGHGIPVQAKISLEAEVDLSEMLGNETILFANCDGLKFVARMLRPRALAPHEKIGFNVDTTQMHLFERASGETLRRRKT